MEKTINFQKDFIVNKKSSVGQHFVISNEILDKETLISKLCTNKIDEAIVEDLLSEFTDSLILEQGTLSYLTESSGIHMAAL